MVRFSKGPGSTFSAGPGPLYRVCHLFSAHLDIIYGVPLVSILGPLLFNIDLCDLFFEDDSSDLDLIKS